MVTRMTDTSICGTHPIESLLINKFKQSLIVSECPFLHAER